jgi:hypothetical protein
MVMVKMFQDELNTLLQHGNLGYYDYCEIVQIVLFSDTNAINYFTNIDFSSRHKTEIPFTYLTKKPVSITDKYRLAICRYTISIERFMDLYCDTAKSGIWNYDDKKIIIDDAFIADKKFVPESDPTGEQYNLFVPLEFGLYGSNFMGNYYIHELFSKKTKLHKILQKDMIHRIQYEMKRCKLNYRLDKMQDRVGNVVCKFAVEILTSTPKSLGARGIEFDFSLNRKEEPHRYCLHVFQEHDGVIYYNRVNDDFDCSSVRVNPNQCKTTISVLDSTTGLTLFCGRFDYSVYSNYYSQITPPAIVAQLPNQRTLHFDDHDEVIKLPNILMAGSVYAFCEMEMSSQRKLKLDDEWFCRQGYLKAYTQNEHENAIRDIVSIINSNLIWDLQELWIIDPYLCADDLILTALRCAKRGIVIKALNAYSTIHNNKVTKESMDASDFEGFKKTQHDKLQFVLGKETDIKLEYRSVRKGYGVPFHDRYIMLKYDLNKDRVWSLGASINSIGKCHSIIQIVEAPDVLLSLFDKLWSQTESDECLLFNNIN